MVSRSAFQLLSSIRWRCGGRLTRSSGTAFGSLTLPWRLQSPVRNAQPPASQRLILPYARASLLREIHRASECALQGLLRPIGSRGEAKLVSPRGFQKVNLLIICILAKINSRGEFHETPSASFQLFGRCRWFHEALFNCSLPSAGAAAVG